MVRDTQETDTMSKKNWTRVGEGEWAVCTTEACSRHDIVRAAWERGEEGRCEGCHETETARERGDIYPADLDTQAVTELTLYIENDYELYSGQGASIRANLEKKLAKGVYDSEKAAKLWGYLAESGAKKYHKEFCGPGKWFETFPPAVRREVAKNLRDSFEAEQSIKA